MELLIKDKNTGLRGIERSEETGRSEEKKKLVRLKED